MTVLYSRSSEETVRGKAQSLLNSRWTVAGFAVLSVAFAALTAWDALVNLYNRWAYEDEYGYGILAAALVPLFLWRRWHVVRELAVGPRWPGLILVIAAQSCGVLGALGESYFIEQVAFVFTLLGLALMVLGIGPIRILLPLTLILLLTIPLPYTLQAIVTVKLQLLSTDFGVAIIRLVGIPVFVDGNVIDLGNYKLQVVEACSGLRYLLPLTCISLILAFLYQAPLWKRVLVVASAPPITVLINSLRIAIIAVLVDSFGPQMAEGFLHEFEGWVIFLLGGFLLGLEILAFEGFRMANVNILPMFEKAEMSSSTKNPISLRGSAAVGLIVCIAAFGVVSTIAWAHQFSSKPVRQNFAVFPHKIGEWSGREGQLEPTVASVLSATDYYIGDFSLTSNRSPVNIFVAYYDTLSKGAAIHSPRVCLPGSGWEFISFEERSFGELAAGATGTFNRVIIQKGESKMLMYYWFQQRERQTANEFGMKYYVLVDRLKSGRTDGALLRLSTPIVSGGQGLAEADQRLRAFAGVALPKMSSYLPK